MSLIEAFAVSNASILSPSELAINEFLLRCVAALVIGAEEDNLGGEDGGELFVAAEAGFAFLANGEVEWR